MYKQYYLFITERLTHLDCLVGIVIQKMIFPFLEVECREANHQIWPVLPQCQVPLRSHIKGSISDHVSYYMIIRFVRK